MIEKHIVLLLYLGEKFWRVVGSVVICKGEKTKARAGRMVLDCK